VGYARETVSSDFFEGMVPRGVGWMGFEIYPLSGKEGEVVAAVAAAAAAVEPAPVPWPNSENPRPPSTVAYP